MQGYHDECTPLNKQQNSSPSDSPVKIWPGELRDDAIDICGDTRNSSASKHLEEESCDLLVL